MSKIRKAYSPKLTVDEIVWLFKNGYTIRTDYIRHEGYYHWLYYMGGFKPLGTRRTERACYNLARKLKANEREATP